MILTRTSILDSLLIFVSSLLIFTVGLSHQEIIGFESRFYLFALEMWRHGPTWFPTVYHQSYPDYPVTSTWLIYFFAKLTGHLNKFIAILPSAIASAITMVATYSIGALHARRWGWYAVGFLLLTAAFVMEARTLSLDQFVTAATALCFYLAYSAQLQQKKPQRVWMLFLMACSFAIRGPIGLVIPAGVVCMFYGVEKEIKSFFIIGFSAFVLLFVSVTILLGLAYHVGGAALMKDVLQMEVLGRMPGVNAPPVYYYVKDSIGAYAITYPLSILISLIVLPQFFKSNLSKEIKFLRMLIGWVLVIIVGLSIPGDKKIRYVLPMAPALALLCGYVLMMKKQRQWVQNIIFSLGVFSFLSAFIFIFEPMNLKLNRTQHFVEQIESLRMKTHAQLVFYNEGTDGLVIKYLVNMPEEESPLFINTQEGLQALTKPALVITKKENVNAFPQKIFRVAAKGKIGHTDVIVFSKSSVHL